MELREFLAQNNKAQLQGCYVYWFPGKEVLSARDRLATELFDAMSDPNRVRHRFDSLSKAQQGFLISLLVRHSYSGTVDEVRSHKYGRAIEAFEVEGTLKLLQEAGYIARTSGTGGYANEVFTIPLELAQALLRTVSVEERLPLQILSLDAFRGLAQAVDSPTTRGLERCQDPGSTQERMALLSDAELRSLAGTSLIDHGGILVHSSLNHLKANGDSQASAVRLSRPDWRRGLEAASLGTTGILNLKDYGIDLEEEGLFIFQELVYETNLEAASEPPGDCDREICAGADLIIDLDRALELLRTEALEVTREGNVYKKIEDRIAGQFVTAHYGELHEGSAVGQVIELGRKLQFFDEEDHKMVVDPLRRWVWRKKPLLEKVGQIFEIYANDKKGHRWSFHQTAIREIFLDHMKRVKPGQWLLARPLLSAVISKYLLGLDALQVRKAYQDGCTGDFKNETLVVPLPRLHYDLSYWILHRLSLLGIVDVGYRAGSFHALRLSSLGRKLFEIDIPDDAAVQGRQMLVNPDFEILIYPEADEGLSWETSLFADRLESDRVKRYRLSRESLKRGAVAGVNPEEVVRFLESNARAPLPHNVLYSLKEWTDGVELVRLQKVRLLRAQTSRGADRMASLLESKGVTFERLNETTVMVRGGKNERAVLSLQEFFRDHGLFVE